MHAYAKLFRLVMIRQRWHLSLCRPISIGRVQRLFNSLVILVCLLLPTHGVAQDPAPPTPPKPDQKIVNNPFTPGGVTTLEQTITRDEVIKLLAEQEKRIREELSTNINSEEISKLIANAAGSPASVMAGDISFIGCVNGVPLYRDDEGALSMGTQETEEMKKQRCPS